MADAEEPLHNNGRRHGAEDWLLRLVQQMVLSLMDERDKRYEQRFQSQQAAITKAEVATEKRFESVNEFRRAMSDRDIIYMPRAEASAQYASLAEKMDGHSREDNITHEGISKRMEGLTTRVDTFEGTISGSRMMLATIAGIAVFLVAVITIGTFVFTGKTTPTPQVVYVPAPAGSLLPTTPPQPAPR